MASRILKVSYPDGSVDALVRFPKILWDVFNSVGCRMADKLGLNLATHDPHGLAVRLLVSRLEEQAEIGSLKFLPGNEWQTALEGNVTSADTASAPNDFDRSMLHLDAKRKSSYSGVFTYGTGFKARARHSSGFGEIELGLSYKTAEAAAVARYYYYFNHESLAYGDAEDECMAMRRISERIGDSTMAALNDTEIWPHVVDHLNATGRIGEVFHTPGRISLIPGPREPQLAARRAKQPLVEEDPEMKARLARAAATVDGVPYVESDELSTPTSLVRAAAESMPVLTWSNALTTLQQPAPRRGRPRVHYQANNGSCACGKKWPCPRRQKRDDQP